MTLDLDRSAWKRVRLGDVIRRSREQVDPVAASVGRYVAGGHIDSDGLAIERWGNVGDGQMGSTFRYVFRSGQVLFVSARPYLRKVGIPQFGGVVADKTYVLDAVLENGLSHEFLPFVLSSERFVEFATAEATGSMNPRLLWGPMQRYEFDLPPLGEQKRLANLMWAAERALRAVVLRAIMRVEEQLLSELVDASPGPLTRVRDMGDVLMGRQRSPKYTVGDDMVPYLRVANIGNGELKLDDVKRMSFSPDERSRYSILPEDILVSEGQSRELVGQSALVVSLPEAMCFQNTLIRFRSHLAAVRPRYAQALFRACLQAGLFAEIATQTTSIAHLGVQRFAQMTLPLPELADQDQFLARLAATELAHSAAKAEATSLTDLRAAILADIFGDTA